jgi:hypothetical protein
MISRIQRLMLIGLSAVTLAVQAQETNFFPVMAWNSAPHDLAALKKMRDCGFTVAGFAAPKTLKLCRKAGLMAIVSDARVSGYDWTKVDDAVARRNVTSLVREVGKNPAVYGYYLRDEPGANFFPGLAKVAALVREMAPGKWPYINLFPNYAVPEQLGVATYPEYLQQFCATCQPTTLSYDHYALLDNGSMRDGYWQNLEQMRAAARSNSLPFWNIVLGVAHFNYRELSAADCRFQVFSTLAYGARGIAWFTYFSTVFGNSRMAAIDQFGHPTATWGYLQNVNLQIAALAPTLLQLNSDDVYHLNTVPAGCHGPTNQDLITGIEGGDFMAGDFTHRDGSRYVLVLNKDVYKSTVCSPHYRTAPKRVQFVSPWSGRLANFEGENCWLAPGQGVLLKVK